MNIEKVYLSSSYVENDGSNNLGDHTDVVVTTGSGGKYIAAFFTFEDIQAMRNRNLISSEFLNGKYFWAPNIVLAESCKQDAIEEIVNDLLEEGDFISAFRKI